MPKELDRTTEDERTDAHQAAPAHATGQRTRPVEGRPAPRLPQYVRHG